MREPGLFSRRKFAKAGSAGVALAGLKIPCNTLLARSIEITSKRPPIADRKFRSAAVEDFSRSGPLDGLGVERT
jgi:hypothetical protein